MRTRFTVAPPSVAPGRPVRVLIEDPALAGVAAAPNGPFEVTVCAGPEDEQETCPLVMDGTCPHGPFDVVVGALAGAWKRSVRAGWEESAVPYVDAGPSAPEDAEARLTHHLGLAVRHLAGLEQNEP